MRSSQPPRWLERYYSADELDDVSKHAVWRARAMTLTATAALTAAVIYLIVEVAPW